MRGLAILVLVAALSACADPGAGEPQPAPPATTWDGAAFARHADRTAGLAFDLPAAGYRVAARHFARDLPAHKLRHSIAVSGPHGVAVTVDAWDNPDGLALAAWFERHLAFTKAPPALVSPGAATAARVPAIVVAQPRSEQSLGRDLTVFALGRRVVRVTCHDRDDERTQALCARVLATLAAEAGR
jgi:hypothetical protein